MLNNAYYCPPSDAVVWDQEGFMPELAQKYGDFTVAVVIAHEWGHAVQERAKFLGPVGDHRAPGRLLRRCMGAAREGTETTCSR